MEFITVINKQLPPANQYFVELKMGTTALAHERERDFILSNIEDLPVTKGMLRQLLPDSHLLGTLMDCVMKLFQCRINRICECHKEVNEAHTNYEKYPSSVFLPFSAFLDLRAQLLTPQQIIASYFSTSTGEPLDISSIRKLYFISKAADSDTVWVVYVIDIELHTIKYLDPRRNSNAIVSNDLTVHLNSIRDMLTVFLRVLIPDYVEAWVCSVLSLYYFAPLTNDGDFDSGLYITAAIYFLCNDVPLFFDAGTISRLRLNLAYWLLVEELPV
jgi:hypothetical protein